MAKLVKEIPPRGKYSIWARRLEICTRNPMRPAQVHICDSAEQAETAVDNLNRRRVIIPHPDHDWMFSARGPVVYAIYKGKGRERNKNARVRRAE